MKKNIVSVLLCLLLIVASLSGCKSESEEVATDATTGADAVKSNENQEVDVKSLPVLSLYIPTLANYADDAVAKVEKAMNEHLAANYDFQVKLEYIEIGNFETSINLAMTTNELDVTCYFNGAGKLASYVANGQLLDITDYFNSAGDELKSTFTDAEITASSINGRMYGLVRKYQYGGKEVVIMNADIVNELGIDPKSIKDMDSLGEVLYQVKEAYPDIYTMVPQSSDEMTWSHPYDYGIGGTSFAYAEDWKSTELKSLFELDSFAEFCSYTRQWYEDGLIMADAISNTSEGSTLVSSGAAFACFHNADIDPLDRIYPNIAESETLIVPHVEPTGIGNLQYGIGANTDYPDQSFTLLQALYTDATLATLLAYGIEGEHYVLNAEGKADFPEGITAENQPYGGFLATAVYPDYLILPVKASAIVEDYKKAVDEWNNNVEVSASFGYFFDTTEYTDFVTAYANIEEKYENALLTGSIALEDMLPTIQSELEAIGFYEILEKVQTGLDEYLAQK